MTWKLIREVGIEHASAPAVGHSQRLGFATYAARDQDGTYVIAEELAIDKLVPFRFECRTLRVDQNQRIVFDSKASGIDDGFGCLMSDGCLGIVRRTHWELLIVSPQSEVVDRLKLERFSKRIPRYARWTSHGTFLVVFYNRSFDLDIVEVDRRGQLLWYLSSAELPIGIPGSVQLLEQDTLLIADSFRHYVGEVSRDGKLLWRFGEPGNPSNKERHLSNPSAATQLPDGGCIVADTRNHRVLAVPPSGEAFAIEIADGGLCDPNYATVLENGDYLICDTGNARIAHVDPHGKLIWEYGDTIARCRHLSYPRSVDLIGRNEYLVADTGNNRVVVFRDGDIQPRRFTSPDGFFWPRCVRQLASGGILVADARHGRIVEVASDGSLVNELAGFQLDGGRAFEDPHDVRLLPNGHLLVCDSPQDLVVEVDWSGTVYQCIGVGDGIDLRDPHSAQRLSDGSVLIADTGNHRLLIVSDGGRRVVPIEAVQKGAVLFRLQHPRYAEAAADGTLVVADTAQNRILGCTAAGKYLWELSHVPDSQQALLNQPRWATRVSPTELLVCDHFHHRILHLEWSPSQQVSS